jgi:glycosyltransferase involved in cell wall biosynthesis
MNNIKPTLYKWSVVVIARNEEAMIGRALQSVVDAFRGRSYELILVDSASTDRTLAIASRFPTRIVELPANGPLRPSVGRHVGYVVATGEWILFLDGDSLLNASWLDAASSALQAEPLLAGVAGDMEEIVCSSPNNGEELTVRTYSTTDYKAAAQLTGSAVYRRDALEQSGGFNPFLCAAEEAELGARLRKQGYLLRRLPVVMTRHFAKHRAETFPELIRRIRRGFFFGLGQFVRYAYSFDLPIDRPFEKILRHVQFATLVLAGAIASVAAIVSGKPVVFLVWGALMLVAFLAFAIRAKSIRKPAYYFAEWALASPIVLWGFLQRPRAASEFPSAYGTILTPALRPKQ